MRWTYGIILSLVVIVIGKLVYTQAQIATSLGVGWPSWDEWILILALPAIILVTFFNVARHKPGWKGKLDRIENKLDKLNK